MIMMKSHALQEVALILLIFSVCKTVCFLHSGSRPDVSYLRFTHEATDFSPAKQYDYIIVGGGTAGCPLAATLSQNYSVLLLERGGSAHSDPNILFEKSYLLNLLNADDQVSPAQTFTSEDGVLNARGRVLGGSSMINFGFYSRSDNYFLENSGIKWDMNDVERAYEWVEDTIVTRPVGLNSWQKSTMKALLESGVGPANGFTVDHVQGTKISGSIFDDSGRRHGAVEFLNKANHRNLQVVVHATVDRIIFSSSKSLGLAAVGVIYHDSRGRHHKVHIKGGGEVILSAGAIGSPQILLVSGVGPHPYLSSMDIPVVRHHPFVGQFMADNPKTTISLLVPFQLADIGVRVVGITKNGPYIESQSGVVPFISPVSFLLFPDPIPLLNLSVVAIAGKVTRPISSGSLSLESANDVTVSPSVRFNYYSRSEDLLQCANAVNAIGKMLTTRAMKLYKFHNRNGRKYFQFFGSSLPGNLSDVESMETFCRNTLTTFYHIHGGCLVNKVVDSDLKVIGIQALRVVDASTFSNSPGTNPQATLMMFGRYIGIKIHNARVAKGVNS